MGVTAWEPTWESTREPTPIGVRPAARADLRPLRELERVSGEPFRAVGMVEVADDETMSVAELAHFQRAGRAWVVDRAPLRDGISPSPAAYLLAEPVDGDMHIAQVSVHPAAAGHRLGAALIEHTAGVARRDGLAGLCLTTYRDVPWNAPYYRRLGFVELPEQAWGPGLRAIRELERDSGLDRWPRVAMRRGF